MLLYQIKCEVGGVAIVLRLWLKVVMVCWLVEGCDGVLVG